MRNFRFMAYWLLLLAGMTGCNDESKIDSVKESKDNLVLEAPNGEMIATDILSLKDEMRELVARQFGDDFDFEITDIEYVEPDDGYLALITYRLADGRISNYVRTNSTEVINSLSVNRIFIGNRDVEYMLEYGESEASLTVIE